MERNAGRATGGIVRSASVACDAPDAAARLARGLGPADLALVVLFLSPRADVADFVRAAQAILAPAAVVGCTTAGEISEAGYGEGEIVALGFPARYFHARTILIDALDAFDPARVIETMIDNRAALAHATPGWPSDFTFLMVDGLSNKEDTLASQLSLGLGKAPFFGGSAGDGTDFGETFVIHAGRAWSNAAVLVQFRSRCPVVVFKTDHLRPTETRMVVTSADPARRIVREINAEPAAREYARLLGKDPEQLSPFTFAAHPVAVRLGGQHHVRAIQRVAENGDLIFFSAIDEGVVLTLAEPQDMVVHLRDELERLATPRAPALILACDCILRRLEAEQKQVTGALSGLLSAHRVRGFSTYGEQINTLHVNQTLTGVAIYPPQEQGGADGV